MPDLLDGNVLINSLLDKLFFYLF